jgi:hypothetical protein
MGDAFGVGTELVPRPEVGVQELLPDRAYRLKAARSGSDGTREEAKPPTPMKQAYHLQIFEDRNSRKAAYRVKNIAAYEQAPVTKADLRYSKTRAKAVEAKQPGVDVEAKAKGTGLGVRAAECITDQVESIGRKQGVRMEEKQDFTLGGLCAAVHLPGPA